jgi:hypothetical protein
MREEDTATPCAKVLDCFGMFWRRSVSTIGQARTAQRGTAPGGQNTTCTHLRIAATKEAQKINSHRLRFSLPLAS